MSNVFAGKKTAAGGNVDEDFLGGGGVFDTDIYSGVIKVAYTGKSASSEARSVNLIINVDGKEVRSQTWVTNGQGEVTYKDKNTKEPKNLPGFNQITALCLLTVGKELGAMDVEELTVNLYDFDAKKELPQAVDCFTELHGQKVQFALQRQTVDKTKKNESTGKYEPTGEVRDQNEIVKFFAEDKLVTISEVAEYIKSLGGNFDEVVEEGNVLKAIAKMDENAGTYASQWIERHKGKTYDKSSGGKTEGKSFNKGSASSKETTAKAKSSLFDD